MSVASPISVLGLAPEQRVCPDLETYRIGPDQVIPRPVCLSVAWREQGSIKTTLASNGDGSWEAVVEAVLDAALEDGVVIVNQSVAAFDMPVIAIHLPRLRSKAWKVVAAGKLRDTMFREQLLNLALHGWVDSYWLPDGMTKKDVNYRLETLVRNYLGIEMANKGQKPEKKGQAVEVRQDVWQLHFDTLDGIPSSRYPKEAADYVLSDADYALRVAELQDERAWREFGSRGARNKEGKPFDVFQTEWLHCRAAFALAHMTLVGFGVDHAEVAKMKAVVQRALRPEQMEILFQAGILRRPVAPRAYGAGRMTKGKKQSKDLKRILEIVLDVHEKNSLCDEEGCPSFGDTCEDHGLPSLRRTPPSKRFPETEESPGGQTSCDADTVALLSAFDERLAAYERWQGLGKLLDLEIPGLEGAKTIHGAYDIIKKTLRTSCRGTNNYPSRNLQQLPRGFEIPVLDDQGKPALDGKGKPKTERVEPRRCYRAPYETWVMVSVDYATLEMVTLAQMAFETFGYSKLRDVINQSWDIHAWLGAQIASGVVESFAAQCLVGGATDSDSRFKVFSSLNLSTVEDDVKVYKRFRGLGKPLNLGLGGGMGAKRLMEYALNTFGVQIKSLEEAKKYRNIWMESFPELGEYLRRYVPRELRDDVHSNEDRDRFCYFTPLGAYRSCCSFTEAANGYGLQSRAGEGAKLSVFDVTRACWDEAVGSVLLGCRPLAFIHDELIVAVPNDSLLHERAWEISRLMCEAMKIVCPDVLVKAEPAVMVAWEKGAELVLGPDDRLRPWMPGVKYKKDAQGRLRSET